MSGAERRRPPDPEVVRHFLDEARIPMRLAVVSPSGFPSILSLWFLREGETLWCATKADARLTAQLEANGRVAFEVSCEAPPYRGVRGWGRARVVPGRGREMLERLLGKFQGGLETPLARRLLADADREVAIAIEPFRMVTWNYTRRMSEA